MQASAPAGPERFGPYILLDRIGDGGMAEIFLAKRHGYSGFEKQVALKRILDKYSQHPVFARLLIAEAKVAAALEHLNVVQVLDLGEVDGRVFIAMEYVCGRDLSQLLSKNYRRKEQIPIPLSLWIASEFLSGLEYAHRLQDQDGRPLGLIHRDVSPQNVLISYEGEVKVGDFGIARVLSDEAVELPGTLHGKFGYMSPEQIRGQDIDQRSDIFSAGVVLYETLTGQRLFRAKEKRASAEMILSKEIVPPSAVNPEVPPEIDQICQRALSRDRDERYQTVGAFLGDVSGAANDLVRRASRRDLAVYMRRLFGSLSERDPRKPNLTARPPRAAVSGSYELGPGIKRKRIGQILCEMGIIDTQNLELALAQQRARGGRIGQILLETGVIGENDLVQAIAVQANIPRLDEATILRRSVDPSLLRRLPQEFAESALIIPIAYNEDRTKVQVATSDPYDLRALLEAKVTLGVSELDLFVAPKSAVRLAIRRWYRALVQDEHQATGSFTGFTLEASRTGRSGSTEWAPSRHSSSSDIQIIPPKGESPRSQGVAGFLQELSALDLVQTLERGNRTAQVEIEYQDGRRGLLGVLKGDVKACESGDLRGEEAFFSLTRPGPGTFRVDYREPTIAWNIALPNTLLILEAMGHSDRGTALPDLFRPREPGTQPEQSSDGKTVAKTVSEPAARAPQKAPLAPAASNSPPRSTVPDRGHSPLRREELAFPDALIDEVLGDD